MYFHWGSNPLLKIQFDPQRTASVFSNFIDIHAPQLGTVRLHSVAYAESHPPQEAVETMFNKILQALACGSFSGDLNQLVSQRRKPMFCLASLLPSAPSSSSSLQSAESTQSRGGPRLPICSTNQSAAQIVTDQSQPASVSPNCLRHYYRPNPWYWLSNSL